MKWTVVWHPDASDLLADLWNNGPDRAAIQGAADRIDWVLKRNPHSQGEERGDDARILIEPPLAIYFTISDDDMLVSIYDVWRWTPKP